MATSPSKYERHIEENLVIVALVIKHHGDVFWPTFHVLERELDKCRSERKKLDETLGKLNAAYASDLSLELN